MWMIHSIFSEMKPFIAFSIFNTCSPLQQNLQVPSKKSLRPQRAGSYNPPDSGRITPRLTAKEHLKLLEKRSNQSNSKANSEAGSENTDLLQMSQSRSRMTDKSLKTSRLSRKSLKPEYDEKNYAAYEEAVKQQFEPKVKYSASKQAIISKRY